MNGAGVIASIARFGGFRHLAMEVEIGAVLLLVISNRRFLSRKGDGLVFSVLSFRPRKVLLRSLFHAIGLHRALNLISLFSKL